VVTAVFEQCQPRNSPPLCTRCARRYALERDPGRIEAFALDCAGDGEVGQARLATVTQKRGAVLVVDLESGLMPSNDDKDAVGGAEGLTQTGGDAQRGNDGTPAALACEG